MSDLQDVERRVQEAEDEIHYRITRWMISRKNGLGVIELPSLTQEEAIANLLTAHAELVTAQNAAKLRAEVTEALDAVGIGCIDGEWYYTCEPHGEVPEESLKAALQAAMTLTPDTPAPSQPDKYEETLAAYRKVNTELTAKLAEMEADNAEKQERLNALYRIEEGFIGKLTAVEAERDRLREALQEIRDIDYRGNRHPSATIADTALAGGDA